MGRNEIVKLRELTQYMTWLLVTITGLTFIYVNNFGAFVAYMLFNIAAVVLKPFITLYMSPSFVDVGDPDEVEINEQQPDL